MAGQALRGTLVQSEMQQQLSLASISSVIATAGLTLGRWETDYDGVDLSIRSYAKYPECTGSTIDVQLKCTTQASVLKQDALSWSLESSTHNRFTDPDRIELGVLVVLLVPVTYDDWLHQDERRLKAKGCMYFSSADEWDPIGDGADSKTVHCRRSDILTSDALLQLMHKAAKFRMGKL